MPPFIEGAASEAFWNGYNIGLAKGLEVARAFCDIAKDALDSKLTEDKIDEILRRSMGNYPASLGQSKVSIK